MYGGVVVGHDLIEDGGPVLAAAVHEETFESILQGPDDALHRGSLLFVIDPSCVLACQHVLEVVALDGCFLVCDEIDGGSVGFLGDASICPSQDLHVCADDLSGSLGLERLGPDIFGEVIDDDEDVEEVVSAISELRVVDEIGLPNDKGVEGSDWRQDELLLLGRKRCMMPSCAKNQSISDAETATRAISGRPSFLSRILLAMWRLLT